MFSLIWEGTPLPEKKENYIGNVHTVAAGARMECANCRVASWLSRTMSLLQNLTKVWEVFHCPHFKICSMSTPDNLALEEEADRQLCAAYCDMSILLEVSTTWTASRGHNRRTWGYRWNTIGAVARPGLECLSKEVPKLKTAISVISCNWDNRNLWRY